MKITLLPLSTLLLSTFLCAQSFSELKTNEIPITEQNVKSDSSAKAALPANVEEKTVPVINKEQIDKILFFWFGYLPSPDYFPVNKIPMWMENNVELGNLIKHLFFNEMEMARRGELNHWRSDPNGRLALILLLDLFPRRLYAGKPQAFASDAMAVGIVLEGLQNNDDLALFPVERAFFYLPLEHAEDIDMQNLSVRLYQKLFYDAPLNVKPAMGEFLQFAELHRQQIAQFARFPHRNAVLNRPSSADEIIFLRQSQKPSY